jgi:hypothetical protein
VPSGAEIDAAEGVEGVEAADRAAPTEGASATASTDAIAEALGAGRIDAEQARAQLIDEALRAQLPAGADPALVEELRAELSALLADDPTLARLLEG